MTGYKTPIYLLTCGREKRRKKKERKKQSTGHTPSNPASSAVFSVDGHWTKWGFYSPCTKSCGGGRQYRERTCTDPAPANGGKNCIGRSRENRDCNTHACPTTPPPTTTTTPATTTTPIPGEFLLMMLLIRCYSDYTGASYSKILCLLCMVYRWYICYDNSSLDVYNSRVVRRDTAKELTPVPYSVRLNRVCSCV